MKLDAQWITGFVDGEGCFYVGINPHKEMTAGFRYYRNSPLCNTSAMCKSFML